MRACILLAVVLMASAVQAAEPNIGDRFYQAIRADDKPAVAKLLSGGAGVNTHDGKLTYRAVAEAQGRPFTPLKEALA